MTALESSGHFHKPVCDNPDDLVAYGETDRSGFPERRRVPASGEVAEAKVDACAKERQLS